MLLYITTKKKTMSKQTIIESKFSKKKHYLRKIIKPWMSSTKEKKAPKKYQSTQLHYILHTTTTYIIHISVYKKSNLGVSKLVIHHIFVLFL